MKNRVRQRANHKKKVREQMLERRNDYGAKDLTAYNAVNRIRTGGKAAIVLR